MQKTPTYISSLTILAFALLATFALGAHSAWAAKGKSDSRQSLVEQILERSYDRDKLKAIIGFSSRQTRQATRQRVGKKQQRKTGAGSTRPELDFGRMSQVERFESIIARHADLHDVDANLIKAVIYTESGGNPQAVSRKGAGGLMQLMPATASELGVVDLFDPEQNIESGTLYLDNLLDRFQTPELALWAYNAGPEAVRRNHMPTETQKYVPQVLRIRRYLDERGGN